MFSLIAPAVCVLAMLVATAGFLGAPDGARAALQKPAYTAGDRWVYTLQSSLAGFPGLNRTQANVSLGLSGLVEVDVLGPAQALVGGIAVPGVRAATHASGFLNGTFAIPGNGTVHATGTFSSDSSEIWEGEDFLPTVSNSSSSYVFSASLGITVSARTSIWLNTTTAWTALPRFNLSVGESASASFTTDARVATAISFLFYSNHTENRTTFSGLWSRQVLGAENVTVEAGTFAAFRLNESLGSFPGLGAVLSLGAANETAWFSNDVGYYVRREAYVNGTPVGEMRLKSYTYPAAPPGVPLVDLALYAGLPIAAVAIVAFAILLRRRKRPRAPVTTGTAGRVGELPPQPPEGRP